MKLDYVLGLRVEDFLERRLQTQVFKSGLAKSIHHARVLIRQRHIRVRKQVVNIPSFIVRLDSQKHIDFSLRSPLGVAVRAVSSAGTCGAPREVVMLKERRMRIKKEQDTGMGGTAAKMTVLSPSLESILVSMQRTQCLNLNAEISTLGMFP